MHQFQFDHNPDLIRNPYKYGINHQISELNLIWKSIGKPTNVEQNKNWSTVFIGNWSTGNITNILPLGPYISLT